MAFLEKFLAEEKAMLVSLPYRVGIWISIIDRSGGAESSGAEIAALEKIIDQKAQGMFESAFVHEVMVETCTHRSDWPQWAGRAQDVPADSEKAVAIIAAKLPPHDLDAYRQNVMYIAVEVAKAFREFDAQVPFLSRAFDLIRMFLDKLTGATRGGAHEFANLKNISYEEDVALARLSKALGLSSDEENILEENEDDENE